MEGHINICMHMCMYTVRQVYIMIALPTCSCAHAIKRSLVHLTRMAGISAVHFMYASAHTCVYTCPLCCLSNVR